MYHICYSFQIQDQRYRSLVYIVPSVLAALLMNIPRYVTVIHEGLRYHADFWSLLQLPLSDDGL